MLVDVRRARRVKDMRHRDWRQGLCRWCARPCTGRRRTFCSDLCVHQYNIRNDGRYCRQYIWARDHGVCRICGCDIAKIERVCMILRLDIDQVDFFSNYEHKYKVWKDGSHELDYLVQAGFSPNPRKSLWEVDHIVPVCEGGGFCGPDNLRLLCESCHDQVTGTLKMTLRERRKAERCRPLSLPPQTGA